MTTEPASPYAAPRYDAPPYDASPYDASPYEASPRDASPYDASPYEASPREASPYDSPPHDSSPRDASPYDGPTEAPATHVAPAPRAQALVVPLIIGSLVAVSLGAYGRIHDPSGIAVSIAGFSGPQTVKVWLGTGAVLFAVVQLVTALMMWGKLRGPVWVGGLHRWSGRIAFLLTIPVAVHCLYALGFATFDARTLIHSLLGCAFFGAFTTKMMILPKRGVPGWALPVFGGLVFAGLIGIWLTSSVWFFTNFGFKL